MIQPPVPRKVREVVAPDILQHHLAAVRALEVELDRGLGRVSPLLVNLVQMPVVGEGALQHAAGNLPEVLGPAERGDVPVDELIHRGRRALARPRDAALFAVVRQERLRSRPSLMTRNAGDDVTTPELGSVDVGHHLYHPSRHGFRGFGVQVALGVVGVVAVHTMNAEGDLHQLHGRLHEVGLHALQDRDVLVELFRCLPRRRRLRGGRSGPDPRDRQGQHQRGPCRRYHGWF